MNFLYIIGFFLLLNVIVHLRTDDTDASFFNRSGMVLYTDHKTKLQYLGTAGLFSAGALIPRLDENGKHIKAE